MVNYDVISCEENPEADKSFINIKDHLNIAWRRCQNDQKTTKAAGFHSVNAALVEETTYTIAVFTSKTVQDSQAVEERKSKFLK